MASTSQAKDQGGAKSCVRPGDEGFFGQNGKDGRKLCVRHKQMANQGVNAKLQTVSALRGLACEVWRARSGRARCVDGEAANCRIRA